MKRALLVGLISVVALGAIFSLWAFRETIPQRGQSSLESGFQVSELAPDFTLETLEGTVIRLSELRERKVILNFWASWCAPCRAEMPDFERIYQEYQDHVMIVGINIQEDRQTIERFLQEVPVSYPIALDPHGTAVRAYKVIAQPATFWIDERGHIVERKFGAYTRAELEELVRQFASSPLPIASSSPQGVSQRVQSEDQEETKHGDLGEKYFSPYDLEFLQLASDLRNVAYVADLDLSLLGLGCPARDCIPSIDRPEFETPTEASGWLKPNDLVVSVTHNGVTKAYPVKILNWHEIVNDDFNGEPLAVTFCPLCNSALVFRRPIVDGKILEFGVSGRLYKSDLVMYDRQTASFWSQIEGRAIVGPLAGTRLEYVPTEMILWQKWQERHSVAWVLARPTVYTAVGGRPGQPKPSQSEASEASDEPKASWRGQASRPQIIDPSGAVPSQEFLRDYDYDPYSLYKTDNFDTFGTPFDDERLGAKTTIWGLELNGAAKAYLPEAVAAWGALNDELGGEPILVLWDGERQMVHFFARQVPDSSQVLSFNRRDGQIIDTATQSIWNADGQATAGPLAGAQLCKLPGIPAFWFAWLAFHPKTELFALDPDEAESFFERSNVRVNYDGNGWWLRLDTPEAVLCQVNLADMRFTTLQAMEMTLPATDHDIQLAVRPDRPYRLRLTAITEKLAIYQSKTYEFTAHPMVDSQANLIERTAGSAQIVTPVPAEIILTMPVQISEIGSTSARVSFATQAPTISTIAYSSTRSDGRLVRAAQPKPITEHSVQLLALTSNTEYHVRVFLVDAQARVYRSEEYSFKTAVAGGSTTWTPDGENMALLSQGGRVTDVSSNWAGGDSDSAFGAKKAIDGDPTTEWSSNGDGNTAWIEITLAQESKISGVGFWTRTMGTSAQISKFRVVTPDGTVLGVFDLPDEKQMYNFDLEDFQGQTLRFEVIESSGGNTGAKEIAIYVKAQ